MAIDVSTRIASPRAALPAVLVQERKSQPVAWWAALGVAFLALEAYVIGSWLLSGNVASTPTGTTPVPTFMKVSAQVQEVQSVLCLLIFVYIFLIRPWRQGRGLTSDGMFVITFVLLYWQDPLANYSQSFATYNSYLVNLGSWAGNFPGWVAPHGHKFAEPLIWEAPAYVWAMFGGCLLSNWVIRKVKARHPRMGTAEIIVGTFGFFVVFDILIELLWMRTGLYVYPGAMGPTLFRGHWYQFPLVETLLFGTLLTSCSCLRYFRDDKGLTVVERGVDKLKISRRKKTGLRLLALSGVFNAIFMFGVVVPYALLGLHAQAWPKDIQNRSYFLDGLCGPGTSYHCSSPNIPIPRGNSLHVNPAGQLVKAP